MRPHTTKDTIETRESGNKVQEQQVGHREQKETRIGKAKKKRMRANEKREGEHKLVLNSMLLNVGTSVKVTHCATKMRLRSVLLLLLFLCHSL